MKRGILGVGLVAVVAASVLTGGGREASASKGFDVLTADKEKKFPGYKCTVCHKTEKGKKDDLTAVCGMQSEEYLVKQKYDAKEAARQDKAGTPLSKNTEYIKIKGFVCDKTAKPKPKPKPTTQPKP